MLGTATTPRRARARASLTSLLVGLVLAVTGAPSLVQAATGSTPESAVTAMTAPDLDDEPFGRPTSELGESPLTDKWQTVRQSIEAEMSVVALCRLDVAMCPSPAAIQFLAIVERARQREGLARLGEINRAINLEVRPAADIDLYKVEDYWSPPLSTLTSGAGDCEDYAIAKFVALREAGMAPADLRLIILRDTRLQADHAVVAARIEHRWYILDSRRLVMLDDTQFIRFQARSHFEPAFSLGDAGVRRYEENAVVAATAAPLPPVF